ncbi:sigma-70 family RNA polymerase sigma factor [Nocardioides silvaticus]|uniref:sigma-70 family RNA polymerase sigma factor n=1 Tax=Nocardioides silvaticus TaxID=2201891 RepID=UPI001304B5AD|nr:sigma-70 family RNA polymerase sigma factor [Nocardioides silvaticus]
MSATFAPPVHRSFQPADPGELAPDDRKQRTAELIARAAECEGEERLTILDEVIVINIPVARALAARYRNRGQPIEELEQVACLALTKAVRAYDPARGDDLLVFAVPSILGELKRYFRDSTWTVRPPRRIQELRPRLAEAEAELTQRLGRTPLPSEVAEAVGCTTDDVIEAHESKTCASPDSLNDGPPGDDGFAWIERLPTEELGFRQAEAVAVLAPACRRLKVRDRRILEMRFYEQKTQQQIADELGVTQVQVSRLLQRILTDLRKSITGRRGQPAKAA